MGHPGAQTVQVSWICIGQHTCLSPGCTHCPQPVDQPRAARSQEKRPGGRFTPRSTAGGQSLPGQGRPGALSLKPVCMCVSLSQKELEFIFLLKFFFPVYFI